MGKIIMVTGSSRGIGKEIVIAAAKRGHHVYATMRSPEQYPKKEELFSEVHENVTILPLDVTSRNSIEKAITTIINEKGRLDVVINNAGYGLLSLVETASEEEMQKQFDVNFFGAVRVMQAVLPHMRKQKSGHIINISSVAGFVSNPVVGIYAASKHALEAASASLASNVFPWNIKVTVVEPGPVATEFAEVMITESPSQNFNKKLVDHYNTLLKTGLSQGQPPQEVGELVADIIEMDNPDFRYQTNERMQQLASRFLVDTTGNQWLDEQKESIKSLNLTH